MCHKAKIPRLHNRYSSPPVPADRLRSAKVSSLFWVMQNAGLSAFATIHCEGSWAGLRSGDEYAPFYALLLPSLFWREVFSTGAPDKRGGKSASNRHDVSEAFSASAYTSPHARENGAERFLLGGGVLGIPNQFRPRVFFFSKGRLGAPDSRSPSHE